MTVSEVGTKLSVNEFEQLVEKVFAETHQGFEVTEVSRGAVGATVTVQLADSTIKNYMVQ